MMTEEANDNDDHNYPAMQGQRDARNSSARRTSGIPLGRMSGVSDGTILGPQMQRLYQNPQNFAQQQSQTLAMSSTSFPAEAFQEPSDAVRASIFRRLNAIAREEEEIAQARAMIIQRELARRNQQPLWPTASNQSGYIGYSRLLQPSNQASLAGHPEVPDRRGSAAGAAFLNERLSSLAIPTGRFPSSSLQNQLPSSQQLDTTSEGRILPEDPGDSMEPSHDEDKPKSSKQWQASGSSEKKEGDAQTSGDEERDESDASEEPKSTRKTFPMKLYNLLEESERDGYQDIISWQPHGGSFIVHNIKRFTTEIMPRYFAGGKINTFQKQLNLYGFQRITQGPEKGAYFHKYFVRGKPRLCQRIRRQKLNLRQDSRGCQGASTDWEQRDGSSQSSSGLDRLTQAIALSKDGDKP